MTRICLDGLEVDCTIGVFDPERNRTQPVTVHIEVHLDTSAAAREDALFRTRDYGALSDEITFILQSGRFYLLEAAAQVLLRWLLLPPAEGSPVPPIEFARVRLAKPDALPGGAVAVVQVEGKGEVPFQTIIDHAVTKVKFKESVSGPPASKLEKRVGAKVAKR